MLSFENTRFESSKERPFSRQANIQTWSRHLLSAQEDEDENSCLVIYEALAAAPGTCNAWETKWASFQTIGLEEALEKSGTTTNNAVCSITKPEEELSGDERRDLTPCAVVLSLQKMANSRAKAIDIIAMFFSSNGQ